MNAPNTLGVLLAGFSGLAHQNHQGDMYAPGFGAHSGFRVVGVADAPEATPEELDRSRAHAGHFDVPVAPDLYAALDRPDVDVVSVCVPFGHRVDVVTAALRAGKHVLVDKPMALTVAECEKIAAVAAETRRVCVPAHHQRFSPPLRTARDAVAGGRVGLPWNVQADFVVAGGGEVFPLGELVNFAPYPIDVVRALTGLEVTDVYATAGARFHDDPAGPDDLAVLCLTHERGLTSTIVVGRSKPLPGVTGPALHRYRISGSHGTLVTDATRPAVQVRTVSPGPHPRWASAGTVHRLLDDLHTSITTGRPAELGPADAIAAVAVVTACQESIATGRRVSLSSPKVVSHR